MEKVRRKARILPMCVALLCMAGLAHAQQPSEVPTASEPPASTIEEPAYSAGETPPAGTDAELEAALAADQPAEQSGAPRPSGGLGGNIFNPDISGILLLTGALYSHDDHVPRGGHSPTENGFNWQELEIGLQSVVDPFFRFDAFLSFPAPDEVEIEECYATTLELPMNLEVRLGQYLTSFGRVNPLHLHIWSFVDPPLPMSRFLGEGEGLRAIGAELNYLVPLPFFLKVTYNIHEPSEPEEGDEPAPGVVWKDYLQVGRLEAFLPFGDEWSIYLGASAADGPNDLGDDRRTDLLGADLYLKYKPVTGASFFELGWTVEGMWRRRATAGPDPIDWGAYTELDVRIAQRWRTAARFDVAGGQFEPLPADTPRSDETDRPQWRAGASLTFQPTEFSQLRAHYSFDHPDWLSHPVHEAFLQAIFSVGAHGAHPF